jgi:hypothetical protein
MLRYGVIMMNRQLLPSSSTWFETLVYQRNPCFMFDFDDDSFDATANGRRASLFAKALGDARQSFWPVRRHNQ